MAKAWRLSRASVVALLVALPVGAVANAQEAPSEPAYEPARCEELAKQLIAEFEAKVAELRQRAQAFQERQAAERQAFASQPHTDEEWRAFGQQQAREAKEFYGQAWSEFTAALQAMSDRYRAACGSQEAEAFRAWSRPEAPVPPEYRTSAGTYPGASAEPSTTYPGQPPGSAGPGEGCVRYEQELRAQFEAFVHGIAAEKQAFAEQQAREREAFGQEPHTEEEWRAFSERQGQQAFARQQDWAARIEAKQRELRELYAARCGQAAQAAQAAQPAQPGAEPYPSRPGYPSPECASAVAAWERARTAFEAEQRAAREAFEAQWRARWEELTRANAPPEEWQRFREEFAAAQIAFEERHRAAWEAWAREHAPPASCGGVILVDSGCDAERMRLEAIEFEKHLREQFFGASQEVADVEARMRAKELAFAQAWKERREAFLATQPTPEEQEAFAAEERAAWEQFRREMEAEWQRLDEAVRARMAEIEPRLRAEVEAFLRAQAERCWGPGTAAAKPTPAPPAMPSPAVEVRAVHEDLEARRVACILDARIQRQEFEDRQLRALRDFLAARPGDKAVARFEAAQLEERRAFEERLQGSRGACEEALRMAYARAVAVAYEDAPPRERMGSFAIEIDPAAGKVLVRGAHVAFQGDMATEDLYDLSVDGQLLLDAVRKQVRFEQFDVREGERGSVMTMGGEGLRYRFHDNPSGLVNLRADGSTIELDVADYLQVTVRPGGVELQGGERRAAVLGDGLEVDGDRILVRGEATFLVKDQDQPVLEKVANRHRSDIGDAVVGRKVAAEVTIVAGEEGVAAEYLAYEDIVVEVEEPPREGVVSVRVDNPKGEGRTVVLNLERGLLADLARVEVKVFEVEDGSERDARATKARSLADVLEPGDDEGPEYWVVVAEDGVQVLVSFPHFSEKRVEVQGGSAGALPRLVPSFEAAALLAALGAAAVLARGRR